MAGRSIGGAEPSRAEPSNGVERVFGMFKSMLPIREFEIVAHQHLAKPLVHRSAHTHAGGLRAALRRRIPPYRR